ncbi:MAG TPA: 50S ribosomal protein L4 [Planctomycetes bacterium]|nr:50S ribosomal protein L4 [Planctomycetota bacterium]
MATVHTYGGGKKDTREVDEALFGGKILGRNLKDILVMYEANLRQGTVKTKERGEIAGSNKKPWKQKHTGRARAGSKKSPIWRGGGTIFGPKPRDYSYAAPKKQRRLALRSALLAKLQDGEVFVIDGFPSDAPSTKKAAALLAAAGVEGGATVVTKEMDLVLIKSVRNLPKVDATTVGDLNARSVLLRKNLVFTPEAFDSLLARDWMFGVKAKADSAQVAEDAAAEGGAVS